MRELDRDHATGPEVDLDASRRVTELTDAAAELCAAVDALARAMLGGTAIEKVQARDRFEMALSHFSARVDSTAT